ncbi:MAG: tetratricopeptide repeat protein [Pseudomonadota bacterium]
MSGVDNLNERRPGTVFDRMNQARLEVAEEQPDVAGQTTPSEQTPKRIEKLFGANWARRLKGRNWPLLILIVSIIGLVADFFTIFGPMAGLGLSLSGAALTIFAGVIVLRLKYREQCIAPFFSALIFTLVFSVVLFTQNAIGATDKGAIAKLFPRADKIQLAIYARLNGIEESQSRIEESQVRLEEQLAFLVAQYKRDNPDADPTTIEAYRAALQNLAQSGDARKRKALTDYAAGNKERAITDLESLAEDQTNAIEDSKTQAAETWKDIGALAFPTDTQKALNAYRQALMLTPDDLVAQNELGHLFRRIGALDDAEKAYTRLVETADPTEKTWTAIALNNLGNVAQSRGDFVGAEYYYKRSLAIDEELGQKGGIAASLGNLGNVAKSRGDLDAAEDYRKRALAINEEFGRKDGIAGDLGSLGNIARTRGDLDEAELYYKRALAINEKLGRKEGIAGDLGNLGVVAEIRGDLDTADDYWKRALAINEELGRKEGIANQLGNLGVVAGSRGELDRAKKFFKNSLAIYQELGRKDGIAIILGNLGIDARTRGDLDEAEDYYKRALAINEEIGRKEGIAYQLINLSILYESKGDMEAACASWRRGRDLYAEIGIIHNADRLQNWIDAECP